MVSTFGGSQSESKEPAQNISWPCAHDGCLAHSGRCTRRSQGVSRDSESSQCRCRQPRGGGTSWGVHAHVLPQGPQTGLTRAACASRPSLRRAAHSGRRPEPALGLFPFPGGTARPGSDRHLEIVLIRAGNTLPPSARRSAHSCRSSLLRALTPSAFQQCN